MYSSDSIYNKDNKKLNQFHYILFIPFAILILLFPLRTWFSTHLNLIDTYDFGIYYKAFVEIASFTDFNPYISFRNINIFADHFDPILYPVSIIFGQISKSQTMLSLIEALFVILPGFVYINREKNLNFFKGLFVFGLIYFSRGVLSALSYGVHPTTWSLLPIFFLINSICDKKDNHIIFWSIILCLFKEVFPFSIFALGLFYIINKEKRLGISLVFISILFLFVIFYIRPLYVGKTYNYIKFDSVISTIMNFKYKDFLKLIYPSLIPIFFIFKYDLKNLAKYKLSIVPVAVFYLPQFFIHFIANKIYYHYGVIIAAPIFCYTIFNLDKFIKECSKKTILLFALFLVFLPGISGHRKNLEYSKILFQKFNLFAEQKITENKKIEKALREIPKGESIFATSGLITRHLITAQLNFYQINNYTKQLSEYSNLAFNLSANEMVFPYNKNKIENIIKCASPYISKIYYESNDYLVAKGPFPLKCFD